MEFTLEELEQMSIIAIRNYIRVQLTDEEIKTKYSFAIKLLVKNAQQLAKKGVGIASMSQGARSVSYKDDVEIMTITRDVKALLPKPRLMAF